jgi:hypothetical protein
MTGGKAASMHTRPPRVALAVLAGATLLVAACGSADTDSGASGTQSTAPATASPPTAPTAPTAPTTVASTTIAVADRECPTERKTVEVATEAFYAQYGRFPESEDELVEVEFLREATGIYSVDADTGEVTRVPDVPCLDERETDASEAVSADEIYTRLTDDEIEAVGGPECAREIAMIIAAGERFVDREGRDPESLDDLDADLDGEPTLWTFDVEADSIVPAEGSPCPDVFSTVEDDRLAACEAGRTTLEVAREAYLAQLGTDAEPTEAELIEQGLIRAEIPELDLVDGVVVPVAGGACDGVLPSSTP